MNDSMRERSPNLPSMEINPSVDAVLTASDISVSKRFRSLTPEKAKQVAKKVLRQGVLTTSALFILVSSGCGNTEKTPQQITPEPTPMSTPISLPNPTEIPTPTLSPTKVQPAPTASAFEPTSTPFPISVSSPAPEPTTKASLPTPEVNRDTTKFVFGEGVTPEQQKEIRDGINMARDWLYAKVGITINDVSVFAFANSTQLVDQYIARTIYPRPRDEVQRQLAGATAFVGEKKDMLINTSSPGWTSSSPIIGGPVAEGRLHTLVHEWLHIFQREAGGYNGPFPHWLNEGGAHYVAARTLADNNVYPYARIREGHLGEAAKVREDLKSMESAQGFYGAGSPYADEYSLGFLATEFLVNGLPNEGIPAITKFWQEIGKGVPWSTAFQASFGKTPDQFYYEFESFRKLGFKT